MVKNIGKEMDMELPKLAAAFFCAGKSWIHFIYYYFGYSNRCRYEANNDIDLQAKIFRREFMIILIIIKIST